MKELLHGQAEFHQNRNDMSWYCCILDMNSKNFESYHIRWYGYDDDYWWNNVSEKASVVNCKGREGTAKKFKLDYETLEVIEVQ